MQKLSKLMLVAVAAIALATPAMAWDFKAAGSVEAHFHMKTAKASSADDITSSPQTFTGTSGAITLVSAQTDGDKSLTFTYKVDYDGGMDETVTLAASNKVGGWTASGTATHTRVVDGLGTSAVATGEDASVTLTDGTMTHVLGKAVHLAGPTKGTLSDAVAGGADAKANVDSYQGYSLGYKVSDTLTATLAIDMDAGLDPECHGSPTDHFAAALTGENLNSTCFGVNVDGSAGDIAYGFSFGTGSSSDDNGTRGASGSSSVIGLAVSMVIGEGTAAFDYATESVSSKTASTITNAYKVEDSEMELSYKHTLDADSHVVINFGTKSLETTTAATADKPTNTTGLELGYSTKVGDVTLAAGYGSSSVSDANDTSGTAGTGTNGKSDTDIGVKMSFTF